MPTGPGKVDKILVLSNMFDMFGMSFCQLRSFQLLPHALVRTHRYEQHFPMMMVVSICHVSLFFCCGNVIAIFQVTHILCQSHSLAHSPQTEAYW